MMNRVFCHLGDELFETDENGKPVVPETVTKERLAEALIDAMDTMKC